MDPTGQQNFPGLYGYRAWSGRKTGHWLYIGNRWFRYLWFPWIGFSFKATYFLGFQGRTRVRIRDKNYGKFLPLLGHYWLKHLPKGTKFQPRSIPIIHPTLLDQSLVGPSFETGSGKVDPSEQRFIPDPKEGSTQAKQNFSGESILGKGLGNFFPLAGQGLTRYCNSGRQGSNWDTPTKAKTRDRGLPRLGIYLRNRAVSVPT